MPWIVVMCLFIAINAIECHAVGRHSDGHRHRCDNGAILRPMVSCSRIFVGESRVDSYVGFAAFQFVLHFLSPSLVSVRTDLLTNDAFSYRERIIRENHARIEFGKGNSVSFPELALLDSRRISEIDCNIFRVNACDDPSMHTCRRRFSKISKDYGNHKDSVDRSHSLFGSRNLEPWSLINLHLVELTVHNGELVDSSSRQHSSKPYEEPIRKAATFDSFAKSHRLLFFLVSLIFSFCACFCLSFGVYLSVQNWSVWQFLLYVFLGVLFFSLVFALAHASYAVSFSKVSTGDVII